MKLFDTGKGLRALPVVLLGAALMLPLAGCDTDQIVRSDDPERVRPEDVSGVESIPSLVNGAVRQFIGGYAGFGLDNLDAFVTVSGGISDELYWGDTFVTRQAVDQRRLQSPALGNIMDTPYLRLHQARLNARRAVAAIDEFGGSANDKVRMRAIEGYTYVTFSEGWCGSVPFSQVAETGPIDPFAADLTRGLTTAEMSDSAVVRFDAALAAGGTLAANLNLARVGKGRALLNRGNYAAAAAAVAAVPDAFVFLLNHSINATSQNNPVWATQDNGRWGVSNLEGAVDAGGAALRPDTSSSLTAASAEGLPFRAFMDPRLPWAGRPVAGNACFAGTFRCWMNRNYPNQDADLPLASGVEARLIQAEFALNDGRPGDMMTILNALRANMAAHIGRLYPDAAAPNPFADNMATASAPLADPGTAAGRRDLLFRERALWLYNTGHRQGDLRRLVRQYGVPSNQAFPSGPYFRGGTYGDDVNFPVPFREENNPQFNRASCVTTQA